MKKFNIAIDGPSGVGKSTIAKRIATKYNMIHLDTGAMYRCIAYFMKQHSGNIVDKLNQINIEFKGNDVYLNNENVTTSIRNDEISILASNCAKIKEVRQFLVQKQQEIATQQGYILDGRDIGSVVLPNAQVKFFLTAQSTTRANRRFIEYQNQGLNVKYEDVLKDIEKRDLQDSTRTYSPLIKVVDAYELDTTNKTIDEVVNEACCYIESRVNI